MTRFKEHSPHGAGTRLSETDHTLRFLGWRGGERASFGRGELRLKRIGDFLRYFGFRPQIRL